MAADLPEYHRPRLTVGTLVSITVLFLSVALVLAFSAIRVGQGIERDSRAQDRAELLALRASQSQSVEITNCARRLNAAYVLADNNARHLWNTFVTDPNLDREKAKKDLMVADAAQYSAAVAVDTFAKNPVLPCPIVG